MDKKLQAYVDRFGEGFPMMPLAWGREYSEVIQIIDECLEKGKDVYELGYVTDDEDTLY